MMRSAILPALITALTLGCGGTATAPDTSAGAQQTAHDFSTPAGAILSLEDAYRAGDIEAAVRCRDFKTEAELMLAQLSTDFSADTEILEQTAEVLELGYRAELAESMPDFDGVTSEFSEPTPYKGRDDVVEIIETISFNGQQRSQKLHAARTGDGWRVVTIQDEE